MKHTVLISLILITLLIANLFSGINVNYVEPVKNGDQLNLQITEVPANVGVKYIFMMKTNHSAANWQEYVLLDKHNLKVSSNGVIEGKASVKDLDVNDASATLLIVLENGSIVVLEKSFSVLGDKEEVYSPKLVGTFSISDSTGGTFGVADTAKAVGSGFDANEVDILWSFQELDAEDNIVQSTTTTDETIAVDGSGNLTGIAVRDGTAFDPDAVKIQLFGFFLGSSGPVTSTNTVPINEANPPGLIKAYAFDLNTIRLVFDEPVSEGGDASGNFNLTGSPATPSDLIPVGSQPTANWNLTLSPGFSDRGVSGVTINYTGGTGTDSLADAAGNEVENTSPDSTVQDSIPPDVTLLRDSANSAALTIGEFLGNTTYTLRARVTNGNNDSSLDNVLFEGSDNGTSWTTIGTDATPTASGSDADFEVSWDIGAVGKFKVLRAIAFDSNGNTTASAVVGSSTDGFNNNFEDTYRAIITQVVPSSISASSSTFRARLTVKFQNNYGDSINTTGQNLTLRFTETTTTTELWWDAVTGGTSSTDHIDLTINSSADSGNVWYSNTTPGGPNTLVLAEQAGNFAAHNGVVTADGHTITVVPSTIVTVSNPTPLANSNIDTIPGYQAITLSVDMSGSEDPGVSDDFRFIWGFNNSASPGSYGVTDTSVDLTVAGGVLDFDLKKPVFDNIGNQYSYLYWWVENLSLDPNATILEGEPISSSPSRLIVNPHLITEAGIGGGDVSGGSLAVGQSNQELVSIKFSSNPLLATILISGLVFDITASSTVDGFDISTFHLYRDSGSLGTYDGEVELDNASFGGGFVNFNSMNLSVIGSDNYILVTVDVLPGADPTHTLGLVLPDEGAITIQDNVINGGADAIILDPFSNLGTSSDVPLPVDLVSFVANSNYGKAVLEWETASELNNEGFFIHRSDKSDGNYEQLNTMIIPGNGNSNTSHQYEYTDKDVEGGQTYYYKLISRDFNGDLTEYESVVSATVLEVPESFNIAQNYPNPFNPQTYFRFSIAEPSRASLKIYNVLGQAIRTIFDNRVFDVGVYEDFSWDATDDAGRLVANGIYYYEFHVPSQNIRQVKKMLFLK